MAFKHCLAILAVLALAALPALAKAQLALIRAGLGLTKKVLVLDLDNTLYRADSDLFAQIEALARRHKVTPFTVVFAGALTFVIAKVIDVVKKLRQLSPLYEMVKEGIDLTKIQWAAH